MTDDIRTMTLPQILAASRDVRNAAVEWYVFDNPLVADTDQHRFRAAAEWGRSSEWRFVWRYDHLVIQARKEQRGIVVEWVDIDTPDKMFDFWKSRHGQPWQASLEAHVAAYRAPARDFHAGMGMAWLIVERLKERTLENSDCEAKLWAEWCREPFRTFSRLSVPGLVTAGWTLWNLTPDRIVEAGLRATWKPQETT